jgi:hypothetical protein
MYSPGTHGPELRRSSCRIQRTVPTAAEEKNTAAVDAE